MEKRYVYKWGNTKDVVGRFRLQFKNRICRILVYSKRFNSVLIQFVDNGELLNTSLNAIRKLRK